MRILFLMGLFFGTGTTQAQKAVNLGLNYYSRQPVGGALVPTISYQSVKNFYGELRYNYEDLQTISALVGKKWEKGDKLAVALTPMLGLVWGNTKGATTYLAASIEKGAFTLSTEPQYVISFNGRENNFYYNWSEVDYSIGNFFTGIALQHTKEYRTTSLLEPGIVAGFDNDTWLFPFYMFKGAEDYYFVAGISWKWRKR